LSPEAPQGIRPKSFMATILESSVMEVLRTVKYPGYSRDIVSFGLVKGVQIDGSAVGVLLELTAPNPEIGNQIADAAKAALRDQIEGITDAHVQVHLLGQLGMRLGACWVARRASGLRHLRPQHPADDGHPGAAHPHR